MTYTVSSGTLNPTQLNLVVVFEFAYLEVDSRLKCRARYNSHIFVGRHLDGPRVFFAFVTSTIMQNFKC